MVKMFKCTPMAKFGNLYKFPIWWLKRRSSARFWGSQKWAGALMRPPHICHDNPPLIAHITHTAHHKLHISNQVTQVNASPFSRPPENNFHNKIVTTLKLSSKNKRRKRSRMRKKHRHEQRRRRLIFHRFYYFGCYV